MGKKTRFWIEECAICHMKMRDAELHRHLLNCHRIDPFTGHDVKVEVDFICTCDICGRVLVSLAKKKRHMETVHCETEAGKEVKCFICDSTFAKKSTFTRHLHETHGDAEFEGSKQGFYATCP